MNSEEPWIFEELKTLDQGINVAGAYIRMNAPGIITITYV